MRSKALKNKLEEQSSRDIQRFMNPGARTSNVMGSSQAKKLRAARDAMKKAGEEFSTGLDDYNMANIITNDEIAANITKFRNPPESESAKSSRTPEALTSDRIKQIARTTRQDFAGGRDLTGSRALSPLKMRQLGATPVTQAEVDASAPKTPKAVVRQTRASSNAIEAAKERVAARQAEYEAKMKKVEDDFDRSGYAFRVGMGRDPATLKKDFDIISQQEIEQSVKDFASKNPESWYAQEQKRLRDLTRDLMSRQSGSSRASQNGTGELSPLKVRQAGARPVTQSEVDFSGAFDRRAARQNTTVRGTDHNKNPVAITRPQQFDYSTAVRRVSGDESKGAAAYAVGDTPRFIPGRNGELTQANPEYFEKLRQASSTPTITPGAEPEAPRGFRGMAQDAFKVAQDAYQDMRDQQAADFERAVRMSNIANQVDLTTGELVSPEITDYVNTRRNMNRGAIFPQYTPAEIGRNVAQDAALVAPIPGVSLVSKALGRLGNFLTKPLNTGKGSGRVLEPTVGKPGTGPASSDPSFGTSRVGGDEAEAFLTGRPIPATSTTVPDPLLGKPGTGSVPSTPGRVEPTMTPTGGDFMISMGDAAADQARALEASRRGPFGAFYRPGQTRTEPTMGPREKSVSTPPPSTTITDLLKGTQADPIPSSFAQVGTRRTQKVAAPEFKEPKNFTQLQKLYNKGEITPQQYEMYKNRFLTAESKLEYIRTMFREA